MKKYKCIKIILIIIFLIVLLPQTKVNALADSKTEMETNNKAIEDAYKQNTEDLDELYNYINKMKTNAEIMNGLNPEEYIKSYIINGKGNISIELVIKAVTSLIFKEVSSVIKLAISIIFIGIICALLKNLQDALASKSISEIAFYGSYAILIMILSKSFLIAISICKGVIYGISDFMAAILPVLVTMIGLSGGVVQATTMDPLVMGAVVFIPRIYISLIIPLILINFVLQFANNLSVEHKISNLCKMVKQATLWLQGIIVTSFIALLTVRGITSSTLDAVALKTTKFAIDNFVPIVGKSFSDAITSVAGYSLIIKNAVSTMGLLVIVLYIMYPIVKIVLIALIYKFSAAIVEPICDKRITDAISSVGDSLIILLSCILSMSLIFFIFLAIIASSGKSVLGA